MRCGECPFSKPVRYKMICGDIIAQVIYECPFDKSGTYYSENECGYEEYREKLIQKLKEAGKWKEPGVRETGVFDKSAKE